MLGDPSDKWIMLALCILIIVTITIAGAGVVYHMQTFPDIAEEKCGRLNMELFDYSLGGFFSTDSITCWDPETKETRIIQ